MAFGSPYLSVSLHFSRSLKVQPRALTVYIFLPGTYGVLVSCSTDSSGARKKRTRVSFEEEPSKLPSWPRPRSKRLPLRMTGTRRSPTTTGSRRSTFTQRQSSWIQRCQHTIQIGLRYSCDISPARGAARVTKFLQANIKSEAYGYAIADATKAIELDPNFVKVRCHLHVNMASLRPGLLPISWLHSNAAFRHISAEPLPTLRS